MGQYLDFFRKATGKEPFPCQIEFALNKNFYNLINLPTGVGKTELIVLGWLYKRFFSDKDSKNNTPKRLIYCLPMRVLVEQTKERCENIIKNLSEEFEKNKIEMPKIYQLMGGELDESFDDKKPNWLLHPEKETILIGTQDMLLSRALMRGYAMSRSLFPVAFALLHNDALWVFDEIQLMGASIPTSTQLFAFHKKNEAKEYFNFDAIWMSATLENKWLETVDYKTDIFKHEILTISDEDRKNVTLINRLKAKKEIKELKLGNLEQIASVVVNKHIEINEKGLTLLICNTVESAKDYYAEVKKKLKEDIELVLLHSHFRPPDREKIIEKIKIRHNNGMIIISTQVIEAGIDLDAKLLFTEIASWSSLVQRFGRCNRKGEQEGLIYWIEVNNPLPYNKEEIDLSRKYLEQINNQDANPINLERFRLSNIQSYPVIRKKDFVELYDTTPDLAGNDLDISKYIRESNNHDIFVFWRDLENKKNNEIEKESLPDIKELCSVPIGDLKNNKREKEVADENFDEDNFKKSKISKDLEKYIYDYLASKWIKADSTQIYPGQIIMLNSNQGYYSEKTGWDLNETASVTIINNQEKKISGYSSDRMDRYYQTLKDHTDKVHYELEELLTKLSNKELPNEDLLKVSLYHDLGKSHEVFQNAVKKNIPQEDSYWRNVILAKSKYFIKYERKYFRHELASALALIQFQEEMPEITDLICYLVASHHGKIRMSIRSFPDENIPYNKSDKDIEKRYARGIWDEDELPKINLSENILLNSVKLDLSPMEIGRQRNSKPSWTERSLKLLEEYGPFKLAYLEALVRIADWKASSNPKESKLA